VVGNRRGSNLVHEAEDLAPALVVDRHRIEVLAFQDRGGERIESGELLQRQTFAQVVLNDGLDDRAIGHHLFDVDLLVGAFAVAVADVEQ
jgi:hypothetical protein